MRHHTAIFGLISVDPSLTSRQHENPVLVDRPGWTRQTITITAYNHPVEVEAMTYRDFGVHHLTDDAGWTASTLGTNPAMRISSGGRVFADSDDAMRFVETLYEKCDNPGWIGIYNGFPEPFRTIFNDTTDEFEREGVMLGTRVFPS
jgi:hypothetical protein